MFGVAGEQAPQRMIRWGVPHGTDLSVAIGHPGHPWSGEPVGYIDALHFVKRNCPTTYFTSLLGGKVGKKDVKRRFMEASFCEASLGDGRYSRSSESIQRTSSSNVGRSRYSLPMTATSRNVTGNL